MFAKSAVVGQCKPYEQSWYDPHICYSTGKYGDFCDFCIVGRNYRAMNAYRKAMMYQGTDQPRFLTRGLSK